MTKSELLRELDRLQHAPNTKEDWMDLHQTIERYHVRRLARSRSAPPARQEILDAIERLACGGDAS